MTDTPGFPGQPPESSPDSGDRSMLRWLHKVRQDQPETTSPQAISAYPAPGRVRLIGSPDDPHERHSTDDVREDSDPPARQRSPPSDVKRSDRRPARSMAVVGSRTG